MSNNGLLLEPWEDELLDRPPLNRGASDCGLLLEACGLLLEPLRRGASDCGLLLEPWDGELLSRLLVSKASIEACDARASGGGGGKQLGYEAPPLLAWGPANKNSSSSSSNITGGGDGKLNFPNRSRPCCFTDWQGSNDVNDGL